MNRRAIRRSDKVVLGDGAEQDTRVGLDSNAGRNRSGRGCEGRAARDQRRAVPLVRAGNVRIVSRVEPSAANRALVIEVESGSHYSSSEVPLQGEQAPRSRSMFLKNLPAGDYRVVATLRKETGGATVIRGAFQVVSGRQDVQ